MIQNEHARQRGGAVLEHERGREDRSAPREREHQRRIVEMVQAIKQTFGFRGVVGDRLGKVVWA